MKHLGLVVPVMIGAIALAGCGGSSSQSARAQDAKDAVEQTLRSAATVNAMGTVTPGADAAAFVDAAGADPVFLFFDATWCHQQCAALRTQVGSHLRKFPSHNAATRRVDLDEAAALAARFTVKEVPTLLRIEGGTVTRRRVGAFQTTDSAPDTAGVFNFFML